MRLLSLPFSIRSRPILPPISLSIPQRRHNQQGTVPKPKTAPATGAPKHRSAAWSKKTSAKKPTQESNNPFLQGMNFDRTDPRVTMARSILFSQRPMRGIGLNPQDQIRHETIHRAWLLFQQRRRRKRLRQLKDLQDSIANSLKFLMETDERLYAMAVSGAREKEKRFPLVMRIPTNTLPTRYWNYKWTPSNIKGAGGVAKPG